LIKTKTTIETLTVYKTGAGMASDEELISLFTSVGIAEGKAKETLKNKALYKTLHDLIVEVRGCDHLDVLDVI